MLNVESGSRIYLCTGHTDMRKGINGLSLLAQSVSVWGTCFLIFKIISI